MNHVVAQAIRKIKSSRLMAACDSSAQEAGRSDAAPGDVDL
jgi:hypothetical protein